MKTLAMNPFTRIALGLASAAAGVYATGADDAPGAAGMGLLLMTGGIVLGVRAVSAWLPPWLTRTALAVGVVGAALVAFLIHRVVVTGPLFPRSRDVPSVVESAPSPQYAAAIERAREAARAAVWEQNLPGVSVAVGAGGAVVWAEGFGWRDVATRTPVTPATRFNIGTAAAVIAAVGQLGLANAGTDPATEWSPEHTGEPEEDFPPLTILRHVIWQPLGLMPPEYPLPGDRATFYVPMSDDGDPRRGRRLMSMRHLACCANGMVFSSTPSELARVALAANPGRVDGELAGGLVMSLTSGRNNGIVVAVMSNMAHANTSLLALRIGDVFEERTR